MKGVVISFCFMLACFAATASKDIARDDSLSESITSMCYDAGIAKVDIAKCERRIRAIVVAGIIAHDSTPACEKNPERVKEMGLSDQCDGYVRDATQINQWRSEILSEPK